MPARRMKYGQAGAFAAARSYSHRANPPCERAVRRERPSALLEILRAILLRDVVLLSSFILFQSRTTMIARRLSFFECHVQRLLREAS